MRTKWAAILPLIAIIGLDGPAAAQTLRGDDGPAEYPPSSYTGRQYVDSKGCVYVRAGFDGAVTWVPRVNRGRQVLCGQRPTFATTRPTTETPAPTTTRPTTTTTVATTTPRPTTTTTTTARPTTTTTTRPRTTTTTRPRPTTTTPGTRVVRVPAATTRPTTTTTTRPGTRTACPGASDVAQAYLQSNGSYVIRCGPQVESPYGRVQGSIAPDGTLRVAPAPGISPPPGYRAAFNDDRLNPLRGIQTLEGAGQMALVWTQTVPRRLVDRNTGRDVTARFPGLSYPYTSMAEQEAAGRRVTLVSPDGNRVRVRVVGGGGSTATTTGGSGGGVVLSTKSVATETPVATRGGYVQVGTYGVAGNAQNAARVLQGLRLPVRIGQTRMRGRPVQIVMAGPFASAADLNAALAKARRAGFADAFVRR